jgi:hypothetical protein
MPFASEQLESRSNMGIVALVLAVVFFASARTHADPDLWGHVRFGQDILNDGIPTTDSYSYLTAGSRWINHELLPEILFAAFFSLLGVPGLVGLKVCLVLGTIGLVYWSLCRNGMHVLRAGMMVMIVLMLMSVGLWTIRPQLFTYLFFLMTLLLLKQAEAGSKMAFVALPVTMIVWANSHGGFLAGLAVLGIWTATHFVLWLLRHRAQDQSRYLGPAGLSVLAVFCVGGTLVNPYGPDLLAFLLRTATVARPEIGEWQPIAVGSPEGVAYLVALAVSGAALLRSQRPRSPALMAVFLATALLPLHALRHLPLFAVSFAILIGEHLADTWNQWSPSDGSSQRRLPPVVGFAAALAFVVAALPYFHCIRIEPSFIRFPARAVALMQRAGVQGNLATFFDWGEYIIWHLGPGVRVSIDGRRETVYSQEAYARGLQFLYGVGDWDAILDSPQADMALVGRDQPTYNLMRVKPGWLLVYEDSRTGLFAREGSRQAEEIQKAVPPDLPPDGAGLCFP